RNQSPMQIGETVPAHHEFAGGTARLQRGSDVEETAFVAVDLVRKAALQGLAAVVEPLLRVAHPVQQLACKPARATVNSPLKINNIGHNQFCRSARCRRAQIRYEITDRKIDFVAHRRDNWHRGIEYCSCNNLFVELP